VIREVATAIVAAVAVAGAFAQNAPAISHEYADVNGVKLHYARAGHGPLIMFLHGFPEFWYEWKSQIAEFSRDHTVVAPDLRGYNLSSKPTDLSAYQIPKLVEDVHALAAEVMKTGDGRTFTLVGHDWGGVLAWVFAAQHAQMLDKLVIINAPHPTIFARELRENPAQQQASQYMLMFRGPNAEETLSADSFARLKQAVLSNASPEDEAKYVEAWSQPGALTGGLNYYRASAVGPPTTPSGPAAASPPASSIAAMGPLVVKVPTLVIWGEKDTALLTGNLNGLEDVVPQLTVRRIPEGTHWVPRENADEVNGMIREFLERRPDR
jgi:pimeloyl-ACP methyl ester carboxylesterase